MKLKLHLIVHLEVHPQAPSLSGSLGEARFAGPRLFKDGRVAVVTDVQRWRRTTGNGARTASSLKMGDTLTDENWESNVVVGFAVALSVPKLSVFSIFMLHL